MGSKELTFQYAVGMQDKIREIQPEQTQATLFSFFSFVFAFLFFFGSFYKSAQ